jgi:hypothetical protein
MGHTPSPPVSRGSASGPTTCPTATFWRRSSPLRSTGTASAPLHRRHRERRAQRHLHAVHPPAHRRRQIFADVRTYWSPDAVQRVTGYTLEGRAAGGILHLINSGPATFDGTGQQSRNGEPAMKPYWEITPEEASAVFRPRPGTPATWAISAAAAGRPASARRRHAGDDDPRQPGAGAGTGACRSPRAGPWSCPTQVHDDAGRAHRSHLAHHLVRAAHTGGSGPFRDVYNVMNNWGANHGAIGYGHFGARSGQPGLDAAHPGLYAQSGRASRIFRPSAWNAFGANEPMGADFRACANFGPLYGCGAGLIKSLWVTNCTNSDELTRIIRVCSILWGYGHDISCPYS